MHRLPQLRLNHTRVFTLLTSLSCLASACTGQSASETASLQHKGALRVGAPGAAVWAPPVQVGLVPVSAANLPGGNVMLWSGESALSFGNKGRTYTALFNPTTSVATETIVSATQHEMFCTGTTNLPDGRVLVNGGTDDPMTSVYNPATDAWSRVDEMVIPRAYNANTLLQDGRVFTLGGSWTDFGSLGPKDGEVWSPGAGWSRLAGVTVTPMLTADVQGVYRSDNHMWLIPMGNGRVLHAGPSAQMNWIDTNGAGQVISAGFRGDDVDSLLGSAVMYDVGKVLKTGGALNYIQSVGSSSAYLIDATGPLMVTKLPPMAYARVFHNSVVLPNGEVVIVGGQATAAAFSDTGAVLPAELWDPATGTFTVLTAMTVPRTYHSVALLLPDGRVLAGGGGLCGDCGTNNHSDVEILTPPYLLNEDGTPATRPVITSAPPTAALAYGTTLSVTTDVEVNAFSLVRLSSTTHTVNNDQRRIPLNFQSSDPFNHTLQIPSNPGVAVPGFYMLFALDPSGVPSISMEVQISGATTPSLTSPGDQQANVGSNTNVNLIAVDPAGTAIDFGAEGLPPAMAINAVTGAITGTPSTAGEYRVTVSAGNTVGRVSTNFLWRVLPTATGNQPPVIVQPRAQASGESQSISLAIIASDPENDVITFSAFGLPPGLNIDAGTGLIGGGVNAAGVYQVVVVAQDTFGNSSTATFTWTALAPTPTMVPVAVSVANPGQVVQYDFQDWLENLVYSWDFGDNTGATPWVPTRSSSHTFPVPGLYRVTVSARTATMQTTTRSFWQPVVQPSDGGVSRTSSPIVTQQIGDDGRVWVVNPDANTVSVFDVATNVKLAEVAVGVAPATLAVAPSGSVWVVNRDSNSITVISPAFGVTNTFTLPRASQPFGIVFDGATGAAYVTLEATGNVVRLNAAGAIEATAAVGPRPRGLAIQGAGARLLVSRFITPALPGESTQTVLTNVGGGEVVVVPLATFTATSTLVLQHSDRGDSTTQGRGVPNYLGAAAISPDGTTAWVPSKQDNIKRGMLRDGQPLNFQNTIRAITSRISLTTLTEVATGRIDHDNSGVASAALYHPSGAYLFVALETSREIAVLNAITGVELFRSNVGRAPQGLAIAGDRLFVSNFMDRSVSVLDLQPLIGFGENRAPRLASLTAVANETLSSQVLLGKQLFYDAVDARLARDGYVSCASCHRDGEQDGRTWDLTGFGEGLRNTISLRGRGAGHGRRHWSGNFDEVQDFESQIRALSGGLGFLTTAELMTGTRQNPLGDAKAGVNPDLDALAAYVDSLTTFAPTPRRMPDGALTADANAGRIIFVQQCAGCHGGPAFTSSSAQTLVDVGTIKQPASGNRLGVLLTGLDTPTLRDVWATAPYLHDGSAPTIAAAIGAHVPTNLTAAEIQQVAAFVEQIGGEEPPIGEAAQ